MRVRRLVGLLLATAVLAPPVALADSAGDQQYTDPLATSPTPTPHPARARHSAPATPSPVTVPGTTSVATPASGDPAGTTSATASAAAADPSSAKSLPYTGIDLPLLAASGGLLLAAGFGLRRLVRWA